MHRDLKPANIKIRPDGVVKVLDFGLAKDLSEGSSADLQNSPTITSGATRDGVILGTAAYMSPEQAVTRLVIQAPPGTQIVSGHREIAVSADGRQVAFIARGTTDQCIYLRRLDELESRLVPGTEVARDSTFSPDGRWLAFHSGSKIRKVSLSGGAPSVLVDAVHAHGLAWHTATEKSRSLSMAAPEGRCKRPRFPPTAGGSRTNPTNRVEPRSTCRDTLCRQDESRCRETWNHPTVDARKPGVLAQRQRDDGQRDCSATDRESRRTSANH